MRKLMIIALAVLAIVSCSEKGKKATTISGVIENPTAGTPLHLKGAYDTDEVIKVNEDGTFSVTLELNTGMYTLGYANGGVALYIEAGDHLEVKTVGEGRAFGELMEFLKGNTIEENKYLRESAAEAQQKMDALGGVQAIFSMDETAFVNTMDSLTNAENEALNSAKGLSSTFKSLKKREGNYGYIYSVLLYPRYHSIVTRNQNFEATEITKSIVEGIDYSNNDDYNEIMTYKQLVLNHYATKYFEQEDQEALVNEIKDSKIKTLGTDFAKILISEIGSLPNADEAVEQIKLLTDDKETIAKLDTILADKKKTEVGQPSPSFEFENFNGGTTSLESLKGKLVYIDVWATWCGPCKAEIPYLKKVEKAYHGKDVAFVSISVDKKKDYETWKKMVKEEGLAGYQLFADNDWNSDFVQAYGIRGIPRFILLDKEGKIINPNAPRPSSGKVLTDLLDANL